jgi:hypothetical protein
MTPAGSFAGHRREGSRPSTVATIVNNLGSLLRDLGDLPGARAAFLRALAIDEKALGPEPSAGRAGPDIYSGITRASDNSRDSAVVDRKARLEELIGTAGARELPRNTRTRLCALPSHVGARLS